MISMIDPRADKTCHVEPVHSGHPSGLNKLAAIEGWPDYTVEHGHSSKPASLIIRNTLLWALRVLPIHEVLVAIFFLQGCKMRP